VFQPVCSFQQYGMTCGFWSVFNAKAIDPLLCRRMELTSANIAREALVLMRPVFTQEPLWTENVDAMAETLGVDIVLLGVYPKYSVLPLVGNLSSTHSICDCFPKAR
jgi:hypothetical protein